MSSGLKDAQLIEVWPVMPIADSIQSGKKCV